MTRPIVTKIPPAARSSVRPVVVCGGAFLILFVIVATSGNAHERVWIATVIGFMAVFVLGTLLDENGCIRGFGLQQPGSLYGFFYFLYYGIPLAFLAAGWEGPTKSLGSLAALVLTGYVAFLIGVKLSGLKLGSGSPLARSFSSEQAQALLALCYIGAWLVYGYYVWRIGIGQFYTHVGYYEQPATRTASLIQNFGGMFCFPVFILAAILTSVNDVALARRTRRFLLLYTLSIFVIATAASEFREALTALMFLIVARNAQNRPVRMRHVLISCLAGLIALTVVEGTRQVVQNSGIADSPNQAVYSADHAVDGINSVLHGETPAVIKATLDRATWPVVFLSEVVQALDHGNRYLHGAVLVDSLYSLIPRAFWPNKPVLVSTQLQIEEKLHLPLIDASPGPVTQFYADWGVGGVAIGLLCFGILLGSLTKYATQSGSPTAWLTLAWIWSVAVQVETDLTLGILVALRHLIIVILVYRALLFWIRISGSAKRVPNPRQVLRRSEGLCANGRMAAGDRYL